MKSDKKLYSGGMSYSATAGSLPQLIEDEFPNGLKYWVEELLKRDNGSTMGMIKAYPVFEIGGKNILIPLYGTFETRKPTMKSISNGIKQAKKIVELSFFNISLTFPNWRNIKQGDTHELTTPYNGCRIPTEHAIKV